MKRLFAIILLVLLLAGCGDGGHTPGDTLPTQVSSETTLPARQETTAPTQPESAAMGIAWEQPPAYAYEDYFAFERFYYGVREDLQPELLAEGSKYVPYTESGRLMLRNYENTVSFQVGSEVFDGLQLCGTDGFYWIYCIEANRELFRIDPFGNRETLLVDESAQLTPEDFRLEDYGNLAVVSVDSGDGCRIYRIHLPSMTKDLIAEAGKDAALGYPVSNYQIVWYEGSEKHCAPPKQWDAADANVAAFQELLAPGTAAAFDGRNNWYNMATLCAFEDPKTIDLRVFFGSGFLEESPWLTQQEQTQFEIQESIPVVRLQAEKIDEVLRYLFGFGLDDMEADTLQAGGMYDGQTQTYYLPLGYTRYPETAVYYLQQELTVHKVEALKDGCYRVYYLPNPSVAVQSSVDLTEKVMTLRKDGDVFQILSNTEAIMPQGTGE